ncbi:MAG TPA: hypothetical protein HA346_06635 [Thermoplasmata archaeon]|nr:hypothetical protein [Thermoplasmata archaeon]
MEKTDTGRRLSLLIERLNTAELEMPTTNSTIKKEILVLEKEIDSFHDQYTGYNDLCKKKIGLEKILKGETSRIKEIESSLNQERDQHIRGMKLDFSEFNAKLKHIRSEIDQLDLVKGNSAESTEKARRLSEEYQKLQASEKNLSRLIGGLNAELTESNEKIKGYFKILNIDDSDELETVHVKVRNLSFLKKLHAVKQSNSNDNIQDGALWKFFSENEDILERSERLESRPEKENSQFDQEAGDARLRIKSVDSNAATTKYICIASFALAVICAVISFTKSEFFIVRYGTVFFFVIGLIYLFLWSRLKRDRSSIYKTLLDNYSTDKYSTSYTTDDNGTSQIWKTLNEFGIGNLGELRKKYIEYIQYREKQESNSQRLEQYRELELEMEDALSEFNLDIDDPSVESQIGNIEKILNETQVTVASSKTLDKQVKALKKDQKEQLDQIRTLQSKFAAMLRKPDASLEDINNYCKSLEQYRDLQNKEAGMLNELNRAENNMKSGRFPESINRLVFAVTKGKESLEQSKNELGEVDAELKGMKVEKQSVLKLLEKRDSLTRRLKTLKASMGKIGTIRRIIKQQRLNYVTTYGKEFKDEFSRILSKILNRDLPVFVEDNLTLRLPADGKLRIPEDSLSSATFDQLLFAYKVALYKLLPDGAPFIIDNAFIRYDDARLSNVMNIILEESETRQIIILTSDKRLQAYGNFVYM